MLREEEILKTENIRRLFNKTGWSQKKLALKAGVSKYYLEKMLAHKGATEETLNKLQACLEKVFK